jgi:hypothetical protein
MPKTATVTSKKPARMSSDAVRAKTGKGWDEWFAVLDKAGADKWNHTAIAAHLHEKLDCPPWWSQMVAVGYEQERGLRVVNQNCYGDFRTSRSKTFNVPLSRLFKAWNDAKQRARWLGDVNLTVRKATKDKSMRITWEDDGQSLEVNFYTKGDDKSQVAVQHNKLDGLKGVEKAKKFWGDALDRLQAMLNP